MGYLKDILKQIISHRTRRALRIMQRKSRFTSRQIYFRIFEKSKLSKIRDPHLLVNLGCGQTPMAGWVNIDLDPRKGAYFADFTRGIPLRNGAVRHIHCEHLLEHFDYAMAPAFLKECVRVLEDGGWLRLIVPDAEKYLCAYCQNDSAFFEALKYLGGRSEPLRTRIEIVNQVFRMEGVHKFAWDFETLSMVLKEAGFAKVEQSRFGDITPDLNIDLTDFWRPIESLYVNAYK